MDAQENYEQLKRRNRRRLVGALIMVVIATILLVIMLNRRAPQPVPAPQLDIVAASASKSADMAAEASNVVDDTQSTSAVVLEPAASAPLSAVRVNNIPEASATSEHKPNSTVSGTVPVPQVTVPPSKPADSVAPGEIPARTSARVQAGQQERADTAHSKAVADNRVMASRPVDKQVIEKKRPLTTQNESGSKAKAAVTRPAEATEKSVSAPVVKAANSRTHTEAGAKSARKESVAAESRKNNDAVSTAGTTATSKTINKAPAKQATATKPANNVAGAKNSAASGRLTPQQILENKAAGAVTKKSVSEQKRSSTTSTSNVNTAVERTVIQIGAYTTEAQANLVQQRLAVAGVPTSISTSQTSKGTLYRVRSRVYNSRNQALQTLDKVHAVGLDGLVIGL